MLCNICNIKHPIKSECYFAYETKCPFNCDCSGLSSEKLKIHRKEKYFYHMDILYSLLKEWGFSKDFEITKITNLGILEKEIFNNLVTKFSQMKGLIEKAKYLKKKLILKKIERKEQMKLLEKAIGDSSLTSFNGKLVWIISEPLRELQVIHSPIFYTGKYGYKLRLVVRKENDRRDNSINLIFLKGIYDPVLAESFKTNVCIKYQIDQKEKKSVDLKDIPLNRIRTDDDSLEKEIPIKCIENGPLTMIRFELDCSELELPSID